MQTYCLNFLKLFQQSFSIFAHIKMVARCVLDCLGFVFVKIGLICNIKNRNTFISFHIILFKVVIFCHSTSYAESLPELNQYFTDDKLRELLGVENLDIKAVGVSLEEAESMGAELREGASGEDKQECSRSSCDVSEAFSTESTLNRQDRLDEQGYIRDASGNIINNKGYLDKVLLFSKQAEKDFDFLRGGYVSCSGKEESVISKSELICDKYYDKKAETCFPAQIVEIDPKYNYECLKKKEIKEKRCIYNLTTHCTQKSFLDAPFESLIKIISYSDPSSNLSREYRFSGASININTVWGGNNIRAFHTYRRYIKISIPAINELGSFRLSRVNIDDHLRVFVNGKEAYRTPRYGEGDVGAQEYSPNLELRHLLKAGINDIELEIVIQKWGHWGVQFSVSKLLDCNQWSDSWVEQCDYI
ncbi:hypothetical protein NOVO_09210 (plasmid) [Rickettsiales bacterium Ac37b]|nr:hypothetical protein NOVO_09210 [Rickettsiales bacterium Ac37b]